jgi:hypothetical protein
LNLHPRSRRRAHKEDRSEPSDLAPIPENHWIKRIRIGFKPLDVHTFRNRRLEEKSRFHPILAIAKITKSCQPSDLEHSGLRNVGSRIRAWGLVPGRCIGKRIWAVRYSTKDR